jgi:hypothetical protein
MKRFFLFVAMLFAPALCWGQQTTVQATVLDPTGRAYSFLTGTASINCPGNQAPLFNGFTIPRTISITGGDGNGHFQMVLYDINSITPVGCSYNFAITWQDAVTTFIAPSIGASGSATPITGTGLVNLSTPINAYAVLLPASAGAVLNVTGTTPIVVSPGSTPNVSCPTCVTGSSSGFVNVADITSAAFGGRALSSLPSATASCAGTTTITFTSTPALINGDGLLVTGCGTTNSMSTPSAPTVTPSVLAGLPGTGLVVNSATGSSTYVYSIVAIDRFGGHTLPSSNTTITNGLASLGYQTNVISTASLSNDVMTVNTSASSNLAAGALAVTSGQTNFLLNGMFLVGTTPSGSQFTVPSLNVDSRGLGSYITDSTTSTGGQVAYFTSNHLAITAVTGAWAYCIYAKRPADSSQNLIGITKPTGYHNGYSDLAFDDLGSPMLDNQNIPQCPATPPGSAQNDSLVTRIVSGAPGTSVVVANTASQTVSGQTASLENCPAIQAAAATVVGGGKGTVWIPPSSGFFTVQSFCVIPAPLSIKQAGEIRANNLGTIELGGSTIWDGAWAGEGAPQFGMTGGAHVEGSAFPLFYITANGVNINHLLINCNCANGGTQILSDTASFLSLEYDDIEGGNQAATDYMSMPVIFRDTSQTENWYYLDHSTVTTGQVTGGMAPGVYFAPAENGSGSFGTNDYIGKFDNVGWSRHANITLSTNSGGTVQLMQVNGSTRQGGLNPFFVAQGNQGVSFTGTDILLDTETVPLLANLGGSVAAYVNSENGGLSNTTLFTGTRVGIATVTGGQTNTSQGMRDTETDAASGSLSAGPFGTIPGQQGLRIVSKPIMLRSGYSLFAPMAPPTSVTATVAAAGSLTVGPNYYSVDAVGLDGGLTMGSTPSNLCTTTGGNQTCNVSWTPAIGETLSNVWRCQDIAANCINSQGSAILANTRRIASNVSGTSFSDTGFGNGNRDMPDTTATGISAVNNLFHEFPYAICPETAAPSGTAGFDLLYCDATNHTMEEISGTGSAFPLAKAITATSAAFATATTAGTCVQNATAVTGATTGMAVTISPVSTPGVGAEWSAFVSSAGNVTINECAVATSAGGSIAFNIRVIP